MFQYNSCGQRKPLFRFRSSQLSQSKEQFKTCFKKFAKLCIRNSAKRYTSSRNLFSDRSCLQNVSKKSSKIDLGCRDAPQRCPRYPRVSPKSQFFDFSQKSKKKVSCIFWDLHRKISSHTFLPLVRRTFTGMFCTFLLLDSC